MSDRKVITLRKLLLAVLAVAVCSAVLAGDRPSPRLMDLINTRVRNAVVDAGLDAIPKKMVDPAIDDGPVFSYFARPSFQIGVRDEPFATQVIDGHLWTGAAEWMLLLGDPARPRRQRIYTLYKNYLPCIRYTVKEGDVAYTVEAFQYWLSVEGSPPVNFIRVTAENTGAAAARARFAGGYAYGEKDHRCQGLRQMLFNPTWRYEMDGQAALRDGKVIYTFSPTPSGLESRAGSEYQRAFAVPGRAMPSSLAVYEKDLAAGESFSAEFAMPHYPADPELTPALLTASFEERLGAMESYWEGWLSRGAHFEVPESKVTDAARSYVIHSLMSQRTVGEGRIEQHVNRLHYNRFWLRDAAFFVSMYEKWGYPEIGRAMLMFAIENYQDEDGNFLSQRGQLDGWGQTMWAMGTHFRMTGDVDFAKEVLPNIKRAVAWLEARLEEDEWGVMPPTDAFDNEMILGRYTGHNFWAINGLDAGMDIAFSTPMDSAEALELANHIQDLRDRYYERFMSRLREVSAENGGIMPPGLDVPGGIDWGNLLAVYPEVIMDPANPLVTATFEHYRAEHMAERIATYRTSMHHYLTERVAQTSLVRGEQERALSDFYGMLLHTGSCHEGFEWMIFPWASRDYCADLPGYNACNFTPHGWYAADFNILFRNLLVREQSGYLHLASALSPEWIKPGDVIRVENAPTIWGPVSYTLSSDEGGAELDLIVPDGWDCCCTMPGEVYFHVPYHVELTKVTVLEATNEDWSAEVKPGGMVVLPCNYSGGESRKCRVRFDWERKEAPGMSYQGFVDWYRAEYREKYNKR